jgi:hypothetical protein
MSRALTGDWLLALPYCRQLSKRVSFRIKVCIHWLESRIFAVYSTEVCPTSSHARHLVVVVVVFVSRLALDRDVNGRL